MRVTLCRSCGLVVLPVFLLCVVAGCGGGGLPDEITVTLPDGTEQRVTLGQGVVSLADTEWDFFHVAPSGQGAPFLRLQFDENGGLSSFANNTIAQEIFGETIYFDGVQHSTSQAGLSYVAATYGAETSDGTQFTFDGRVTAYAAGLEAANATASAQGEFDAEDPDIMRGIFYFSSRVTLLDYPEGNLDAEYSFLGRRVIE
ncbi:MAG: hypothetical protein JSU63_03485 [Phycisphaerales bacterium]|nr:MAG: hypothetical protein JSU63_03485 [Phycisphaerales bacterium]